MYDFTGKVLKATSVFQPCDKESTPSLNVKIADNGNIHINGVASKVTFVEKFRLMKFLLSVLGYQSKMLGLCIRALTP